MRKPQPAGFTASDDEDDMCVDVTPSSNLTDGSSEEDVLQVGLVPGCKLLHSIMHARFGTF